jgi:hypothetical protein
MKKRLITLFPTKTIVNKNHQLFEQKTQIIATKIIRYLQHFRTFKKREHIFCSKTFATSRVHFSNKISTSLLYLKKYYTWRTSAAWQRPSTARWAGAGGWRGVVVRLVERTSGGRAPGGGEGIAPSGWWGRRAPKIDGASSIETGGVERWRDKERGWGRLVTPMGHLRGSIGHAVLPGGGGCERWWPPS